MLLLTWAVELFITDCISQYSKTIGHVYLSVSTLNQMMFDLEMLLQLTWVEIHG